MLQTVLVDPLDPWITCRHSTENNDRVAVYSTHHRQHLRAMDYPPPPSRDLPETIILGSLAAMLQRVLADLLDPWITCQHSPENNDWWSEGSSVHRSPPSPSQSHGSQPSPSRDRYPWITHHYDPEGASWLTSGTLRSPASTSGE